MAATGAAAMLLARLGFAALGGEPDRGVHGAEASVAAALDDLEEEQIGEASRIGLQIFAALVAIIENAVLAQHVELLGRQVRARFQVVVIIFRDRQQLDAVGAE